MVRRIAVVCMLAALCNGAWFAPARAGDEMTYHGGALMQLTRTYTIFWVPPGHDLGLGQPGAPTYVDLVQRFLDDVGGSGYAAVLRQYGQTSAPVSTGSIPAGSAIDLHAYPRNGSVSQPLTDADVRVEVTRVLGEQGWHAGRNAAFMIFTAAEVESCQDPSRPLTCTAGGESHVCGWHSAFTTGEEHVIYAALPFVARIPECTPTGETLGAPNGNPEADDEIAVVGHELAEMITDPLGDGWHGSSGSEVADLCEGRFDDLQADGHNVVMNGHPYRLAALWSQAANACVLSAPDAASTSTVTAAVSPAANANASPTARPINTTTATPTIQVTATATPRPHPAATSTHTVRFARERCKRGRHRAHGTCRRSRKAATRPR